MVDWEFQHLVEIAIVEPAVPADGQGMPAHDTGGGSRIKRIGEARHILIIVSAFDKELQEPADRHVGNCVEPVEFDAVPRTKFVLELRFDGLLLGRQERADRIVDQVQDETAPILSIPQMVQDADGLDRFVEDAVSSLSVGLRGAIIRQGSDDFDLMGRKKFRKILLRGQQQHRQVAPIHDMPVESTGLFDQPAEIRIQLRRAPRDIHGRNVRVGQGPYAVFGCLQGHGFRTIGPGIHVTVTACLIAQFSDIDLEDRDARGMERKQSGLAELTVEG